MTLICKPRGRGNWTPLVLEISASRNAPLPIEVFVGQLLTIAGKVFRVAQVRP